VDADCLGDHNGAVVYVGGAFFAFRAIRHRNRVMLSGKRLAIGMRLALITIFVVLSLSLPAKAQSFSRQDLDCAVAATIEEARADKGTTEENRFHELLVFFIRRLNVQDNQTNWARIVYDRSKLNPKQDSVELLARCTELYQSSLHR